MKKRRGKPAGMNYADVLERKRLIRQAVQDEVILHEVDQDYAYEKLRLRAEEISKRDIVFYEDVMK